MEYVGMIKNSFNYVFSDTNKLLKLFLPSFVLALMVSIAMMLIMFASNSYNYYNNPYSAFVGLGIFSILTTIIGIFVLVINCGIVIGVIKNTISTNELPEFKIGNFLVDGVKLLIVRFLYMLVPFIIYLIFLGLAYATESEAIILIGALIYYILMFFINLLLPVAYGKLSDTDSISESLSIENIWQISKNIGLAEIFVLLLICGVISFVILLLSILILFIPIIGPFISAALLTLLIIFIARIYALIYLEQNTYNNYYQQPNQNYQQYANTDNNIKVCPFCGHHNIMIANKCIKCGYSLLNNEATTKDTGNLDGNPESLLCPQCGTSNNKSNQFCLKCGTTLEYSVNNRNFCNNCGSKLDDDALFCDNCGTRKY